jgi:hypothetical protein
MLEHAHCSECSALIIQCNVCIRSFLVEPNPFVGEAVPQQRMAESAAVWHVYEEHRQHWLDTIGDRPPQDVRTGRAVIPS